MFCLPNQSTAEIFVCEPWDFKPNPPKSAQKDRDAWREWAQKPMTKHCFFSAFEGVNPHLRISEQNPPHLLHGIVADYDSEITDAMLKEVNFDKSVKWTGTSRTFSGHRRAVWMFEEPLLLHSVQLTKRFLDRACKELRLDHLLPGLDKEALLHPAKYYECGLAWKLGHDRLPKTALNHWLQEASQKFDFGDMGTAIPIDAVAKEVERKFPGQWDGEFQLGARGRRFWDDGADNPTAAIVRETGMQCFTGVKSFVTWSEILGVKFVKKFEEDRLGGAVDGIWFDGDDYWMQGPDERWNRMTQPNLSRHLRVKRNLNGDRGKKETHSEIDRALVMIEDHQRVAAAVPFVHQKDGMIYRHGRPYLNTSRIAVCQPVAKKVKWGEGFEWLASFLDSFFVTQEAQECFLAWLQRTYGSAYEGEMLAGQALFFAGDVGQGKSFLSTVIIAEMMGGFQDATGYLLGETKFNKELFEVALWCMDDALPASDPRKHSLYSAMVKKMVANRIFEYHAKFRDATSIPWIGRVVLTLNKDVESARLLPDMQMNTLDKISLFMVRTISDRIFPANPTKTVQKELPYFCRWLLDWKAPEHTKGNARFGVRAYHDPEMLQMAHESSDSAHFSELLALFRSKYKALNEEATHWKGSATEMFDWMTQTNQGDMRELARSYSSRSIGRNLAKLMAMGDKGLRLNRAPGGGGRVWTVLLTRTKKAKQVAEELDDSGDR